MSTRHRGVGQNGVYNPLSNVGRKLSGPTASKSAEELSNVLRHPTAKMIEGEMKAVDVSDDDLKALESCDACHGENGIGTVAYIKSLK
jgi:hypothetical protein